MAYQNCAQAPDTNAGDSASSFQSTLPFAYKAQLDTISFMSCVDIADGSVDQRAYYTFRAGAYGVGSSGIGLTDDFATQTKYYSNTDRAQALGQSDRNQGTQLNFSIRQRSNYQTPYLLMGSVPKASYDVDSFLPEFDTSDIAGELASVPQGQLMNYFPGTADQRLTEASLRFFNSKANVDAMRSTLEGGALLVAGYSHSADPLDPVLRSPFDFDSTATSSATSVYGTGYIVSFTLGNNLAGAAFSSGERRVLASVSEKDLQTGAAATANWDCSTRLMIVRPEDAVGKCNTTVDRVTGTTQSTQLAALRRVLRVEDWFVDLTNHCAVPKRTGDYCYGTNLGTRAIQYTATTCTEDATHACPHYVSVCIRQ